MNSNNEYDTIFQNDVSEYDETTKRTPKKKFISMFHHEQWRSALSEKLSEWSTNDMYDRRRLFPKNIFLMNEEEREVIVNKINEQLVQLGKAVQKWLTEKHEAHTKKTNEILEDCYSISPFLLNYANESFKNKRQKMVVVLASPSLSQIENQHIDPNPNYSNGLCKIRDKLSVFNEKAHSFVFSIPFFLGTDAVKQDIVETPGIYRSLLIYTRDMMRALNPTTMMAVTAHAFERCLNRFEEKNARETIRNGGSLFYSHMNDSLKGECKIALIPDNPITCYYLPHPFTLSSKDAKPSIKENWDGTWELIDKLWGTKNSAFRKTFINTETKIENKDASDFMKKEAAILYKTKTKKKKDPVRKLPKGKRISIGMDSFVKKKINKDTLLFNNK